MGLVIKLTGDDRILIGGDIKIHAFKIRKNGSNHWKLHIDAPKNVTIKWVEGAPGEDPKDGQEEYNL